MGVHLSLYLGPIVEFRQAVSAAPLDLECEYEALAPVHTMGELTETIGTVLYRIYRFIPNVSRPGEPEDMHIDADKEDRFIDLAGRLLYKNPRAELVWFSECFDREIKALRAQAGLEPTIRWGLLKSCG